MEHRAASDSPYDPEDYASYFYQKILQPVCQMFAFPSSINMPMFYSTYITQTCKCYVDKTRTCKLYCQNKYAVVTYNNTDLYTDALCNAEIIAKRECKLFKS
jgi:hypothetical protein